MRNIPEITCQQLFVNSVSFIEFTDFGGSKADMVKALLGINHIVVFFLLCFKPHFNYFAETVESIFDQVLYFVILVLEGTIGTWDDECRNVLEGQPKLVGNEAMGWLRMRFLLCHIF